ncbi:MAG: sensor domain-containing diguanylate cyclase [Chromatiales bacterium]|jgi:diguanylate cyclase (GGDEF)-like protein
MSQNRFALIVMAVLLLSAPMTTWTASAAKNVLPKHLIVTNSASWIPYSFLDENGQPHGVLVDLWRLIAKKNHFEVEFRLVDWAQSLELVRNGTADVHGGLIATEERKNILHFFPWEILRIRSLVFFHEDMGVRDLATLDDVPLGVVDGSTEAEYLRENFPHIPLHHFPNSELMVYAAIDGEISAFVADYPTGYYHLIRRNSLDQFITGPTLFTRPLQVATKQGDKETLERIAAGFIRIPHDEVLQVLNKWIIPEAPVPAWVWPSIIACILGIILTGMVTHAFVLRRTLRIKTQELVASLQELEETNLELDRHVRLDTLTQIPNRFAFFEAAPREIERTKRYRHALSLVMLDLDHFKAINDQHGHQAGDAVLRHFARIVRSHLRLSDLFARLGGEEFALLLPETDPQMAVRLTQRILDNVVKTPVTFQGKQISVSFSAGIAEYLPDVTLDMLLAMADSSLYKSKETGRARVTLMAANER